MKKYEYVSVHVGKLVGAKSEEHRQIIDEYAKKGYRYVGYIPTLLSDYGKIKGAGYGIVMSSDENKLFGGRMSEPKIAICPACGEVSIYVEDLDKLK